MMLQCVSCNEFVADKDEKSSFHFQFIQFKVAIMTLGYTLEKQSTQTLLIAHLHIVWLCS